MNTRMKRAAARAAAGGMLLAAMAGAFAQDKPAVPPSKWGPADEIGSAHYLTPARAAAAARLVRTGQVYELGMVVSSTTTAFPPRSCKLTIVQPGQQQGGSLGPNKLTYNDDILDCWTGVGTQIDGLGHIGVDNVYYNGIHAKDFADLSGLKKLGLEKLPAMVTRGVLLDMAAYFKTDVVKEGTAFNRAEIIGAAASQGVAIGEGDVVIFHTGWLSLIDKDPKRFNAGEPGLGKDGAQYLISLGVAAVGADQWAVEVIPFEPGTGVFGVHQALIPGSGTYLLENLNTAALARDKAYEFMFVLGHNKYRGAVQSMINPVAIR